MNKVSITKVFKYRCFEPVEGLSLFDEALDNRHMLWNKLVEIDRDFREKSSKIITPIQSDYQVLDQEIISYLEAYIERENHLRIWQSNLQDQAIAKRNYEYQNFAARLANMYDVLVLEKLSITDIVKYQKAIIGSQQSTALDRNRTIVAPYELKTILINAFTSRGKQFVEVNASYSTKVCHHCGALEEVHQSSIMHTCTQCHTVWDQDYNACINLLALYDNKVGAY